MRFVPINTDDGKPVTPATPSFCGTFSGPILKDRTFYSYRSATIGSTRAARLAGR